MTSRKAACTSCANGFSTHSRRLGPMVSYPPPATGVNYNLIDKVEHDLGDCVIWHIINSPDGSFTYDYSIKSARRRRKRCSQANVKIFLSRDRENASTASLKLGRLETGVTIRS
jgi:hypothetical protein